MKSQSSDNEEEKSKIDDEDESVYIKIKKETPKLIYLEKKVYQKLMTQIENSMEIIKNIKLNSFKTRTNIIEETNNNHYKFDKILNQRDETINNLKTQIEEKEKELIALKSINSNLEKKYNDLKNKYEREMEEKKIIITSLKNDLDSLNNKYYDLNEKVENEKKINEKNNLNQKILTDEKLMEIISNYLSLEDKINLFSINKNVNFYFKYKNRYIELQKKFSEAQSLIAQLTSEDILAKYEIEDEELQNIIKKYTNSHIISGNPLRFSIFNCLNFLENIIRKPLQEHNFENVNTKEISNKEKISQKALGLFNNIRSVMDKIGSNDKKMIQENLDKKLIDMNFEMNYADLKKKEIEFKTKLDADQLINIKFEYHSADEIKNLIKFFLKLGLSENYYTQFKTSLINEFSELLYNSYKCLECIKELEICNKIQGIRFNKNIYLIKQMTSELSTLKNMNKSNKTASNKLLQQKNELEIKYNDSLLMNSSLNKKLSEANEKIDILAQEKKKSDEEVQNFKNKIVNDYKIIENKYNKVNNERNTFIQIFLEMKIFFIDKLEFLNKQENNIN